MVTKDISLMSTASSSFTATCHLGFVFFASAVYLFILCLRCLYAAPDSVCQSKSCCIKILPSHVDKCMGIICFPHQSLRDKVLKEHVFGSLVDPFPLRIVLYIFPFSLEISLSFRKPARQLSVQMIHKGFTSGHL